MECVPFGEKQKMTCESFRKLKAINPVIGRYCPYERANVCDDSVDKPCPEDSPPLLDVGQVERYELRIEQRGRKFLERIGRTAG
jgi:hypothetical protein